MFLPSRKEEITTKKNIKEEEFQAVLDLMREERPGRVYTLYRRRGENYEYQRNIDDQWGLYFSYAQVMVNCFCSDDVGCISYRLELNDPQPDGNAKFVGMFFLRQYPNREPELYDAVLGHKTMKELLGREPEYVDYDAQKFSEMDETQWMEYEIMELLKTFLPFEEFALEMPDFVCEAQTQNFNAMIFCQLLDEINRYFLSLDQEIRSGSLPIIEGLTQIAACSEHGDLQFEAAKAAAGALLHHLKRKTLEPDRLVFPTEYCDSLFNQQEICRQALCVDLRHRDLSLFSKYLQAFARELPEVETDGAYMRYHFDPFFDSGILCI